MKSPINTPSKSILFLGVLMFGSCGDTGQKQIEYPIYGKGTTSLVFSTGGWQVELTQAKLAIGPVYFCATAAASADLCPTAVQEFRDTAVIDGINPKLQRLGTVSGLTGLIHSATFDYGISWFPTQTASTAMERSLNGHSSHFEGTATKDARVLRFVADIDIHPQYRGTSAVQGLALRMAEKMPGGLVVAIDPPVWFAGVSFDDLSADTSDPLRIPAESIAANALSIAITTTAPPRFTWSERDPK